mmetsp:Transcript_17055/g.58782  ORF Transcript_17055/g.58782 Transcript_17055/m.58782 type:complete len:233 (+) Transcript_17055:379-1077(+)
MSVSASCWAAKRSFSASSSSSRDQGMRDTTLRSRLRRRTFFDSCRFVASGTTTAPRACAFSSFGSRQARFAPASTGVSWTSKCVECLRDFVDRVRSDVVDADVASRSSTVTSSAGSGTTTSAHEGASGASSWLAWSHSWDDTPWTVGMTWRPTPMAATSRKPPASRSGSTDVARCMRFSGSTRGMNNSSTCSTWFSHDWRRILSSRAWSASSDPSRCLSASLNANKSTPPPQ